MLDHAASDTAGGPDAQGGSALRDALRRARAEAAEQTDAVVNVRDAELVRLEFLRDELAPILAEVPPEIDLFDIGLVPADKPRLFIDMVAFVEMSRDRRTYRLMRDGRHGRICAAESEKPGPIVDAVTDYVARRLVERERLLASEDLVSFASVARAFQAEAPAAEAPEAASGRVDEAAQPAVEPTLARSAPVVATGKKPRRGIVRAFTILAAFGFGGALGALVVAGLLVAAAKGFLPL